MIILTVIIVMIARQPAMRHALSKPRRLFTCLTRRETQQTAHMRKTAGGRKPPKYVGVC